VDEARELISNRNFKILPGSGIGLAGIKAAAIGYRADIVIIDYLQIIQLPGNRMSRYEKITEISMGLHILAQSTGMIIMALSQVTNRDPSAKNAPLGIHSARESGQIEADADAILMIDKFVEKGLRESGCKANRVLRIVKNKNGKCCNIPLYFNGRNQSFSLATVPDPNWEKAQEQKRKAQPPKEDFGQLPMSTDVPF
jgi:replicative DNA helicase